MLPMTELAKTVHFNRSFLHTLALRTGTCVLALLVLARSKISSSLVENSNPILMRYPVDCRWDPDWE